MKHSPTNNHLPPLRRHLLLVAFHFPPLQGSTGIHRSLSFARHLSAAGWKITVLTVSRSAYPEVSATNEHLVPSRVRVIRAPALDAQRHLSLKGRYPRILTIPDRWQTWIASGIVAGTALIRSDRPDVIMSTYPIASAHCIALALSSLTGIPWVADFRDPLAQVRYPEDPLVRSIYWRLEQSIAKRSARIIVTTSGTEALYAARYPTYARNHIITITNGFDEELFERVMTQQPATQPPTGRPITLLHSGVLYPVDRNPDHFFQALAELKSNGAVKASELQVHLRASGNEKAYARRIHELLIDDVVKLLPAAPYELALKEILSADACLLFQSSTCNQQIPAKVFEYLFARKPILALTDPQGDTGKLLNSLGHREIASLDDRLEIASLLPAFLERVRSATAHIANPNDITKYSRKGTAAQLKALLDTLVDEHTGPFKS